MEQLIEGTITKPYRELSKGKEFSISFPLKGYGKILEAGAYIRRIYMKSFVYAFYKVLTSKVE